MATSYCIPYTCLSCSIRWSVSDENGGRFANACRTMPSSNSPNDRSWYSASALRTLTMRFSMRTPVCTRTTNGADSDAETGGSDIGMLLHISRATWLLLLLLYYHGNII